MAGIASMQNDKVAFSGGTGVFVPKRRRQRLDEIKKPTAARSYIRAMLNVVGRPEALGRDVISLVEKHFKRFENNVFICGTRNSSHNSSSIRFEKTGPKDDTPVGGIHHRNV
jgi:hypothetical protein